jgi:hypothetical protein
MGNTANSIPDSNHPGANISFGLYVYEIKSNNAQCILEYKYKNNDLHNQTADDVKGGKFQMFYSICKIFCTHHIVPKMDSTVTNTSNATVFDTTYQTIFPHNTTVLYKMHGEIIRDDIAKIKVVLSRRCGANDPDEEIVSAEYFVATSKEDLEKEIHDNKKKYNANKHDLVTMITTKDKSAYEQMIKSSGKPVCTIPIP